MRVPVVRVAIAGLLVWCLLGLVAWWIVDWLY